MNEGITQCSHGEERLGKTQTNFLAIKKQILSFPLVSKKPSHALGSKHCQPIEREAGLEVGHYKGHWPTLAAEEQLLHNQCQITASNAHATMKNQQKPNARWKETRSSIQSHLSVFACSCCFTNLTYCSKSQIFRNSTGWRYYQEKQSASVTQYNWGIISRILRQWSEKLENQNPREGDVQIWLWTLHTGHWQQHILESPASSMKAHSDTVATNSRTNIWAKVMFSFFKSIWEGWQLGTKNIPVFKYKWSVSAILCSGP